MLEIVGGVFGAITVRTKLALAVRDSSLTDTVMFAVPACPAAGVTVTDRLDPLPPKEIFPSGTSVGFEEAPAKFKFPTGVSTSPIVKLIGPVDASCLIVRLAISDIVGRSLTAVTVSRKLVLALS